MLYSIFRVLMSFSFRCYFRKIKIFGLENIPKEGPILFLSNHPSSFTEPMLLACFQPRILNFLVRGDIFENRFLKPILEATHQIPIYRARDGFENLRKNKSTFERVYQKLAKKETVLIFPESTTQWVRYLRPFQKGAAHMAIGTVLDHGMENLIVIPCGVNFNNVLEAGEDANIHIGTKIEIKSWINQQAEGTDLVTELTKLFTQEMNKVVLSVPSHISPEFYNQLSYLTFESNDTQSQRLDKHNKLINGIQSTPDLKDKLIDFAGKKLHTEGINFGLNASVGHKLIFVISMLAFFILGIPALILFGLPILVSKYVTGKFVKAKEYRPPFKILIALIPSLLILIIGVIFILIKFNLLTSLAFIAVSILSFYLLIKFLYNFKYLNNLFTSSSKKVELQIKLNNVINSIQ